MVLQIEKEQNNNLFSRVISKENSKINSSSRVYYGGASGSIPFMWESQPGTPIHTFSYNHRNHKDIIDTNNCNNMNMNTVNNVDDDFTIPPLTPPPSYYSTANSKPLILNTSRKMKPNPNAFSKSWISMMTSRKLKKGKHHVSPSSSSTASSSSSSNMSSSFSSWSSLLYSSPSSRNNNSCGKGNPSNPSNQSNHRRSFSCSSESPIDHFGNNDGEEENEIKNKEKENKNKKEENDEVEEEVWCFGGKQKKKLKDNYGGCNIYFMVRVKKSLSSIMGRHKKIKLGFIVRRDGSSNPKF